MGEIELILNGLLIFLMDATSDYPLLPSHERALWKNLAIDEVTHRFFFVLYLLMFSYFISNCCSSHVCLFVFQWFLLFVCRNLGEYA